MTVDQVPRYVGRCCREWLLSAAGGRGRCGLCGETPTYDRPARPDEYGPSEWISE